MGRYMNGSIILAFLFIKLGSVIFLISSLYLSTINPENPGAGFGAIFALLVMLFSAFLIVPSTFYQLVNIVKNKPQQSKTEILTFAAGTIMTLFFAGYLF